MAEAGFGGVFDPTRAVTLADALTLNVGPLTSVSPVNGFGYGTGAGGVVTQITSKATAVTLNRPCGQITMNNAALANVTSVAFTLNNTCIAANDVVAFSIKSGATTITYQVCAQAVAAGSCSVNLSNVSAASQSDAVVLNFVVLKGVSA